MVFGAGDGAIYAVQPRTGKTIWKYQASTRGLNATPLVDDQGVVYCGHSEQNASDTTVLGAVFAFNGNTEGEISEGDLLWKIPKKTVGRTAPIKVGERIYYLEDGAMMVIADAKTGEIVGQKKLGRIMFGSLSAGDGKLYAAENTGRLYVMKPSEKGVDVISESRLPQGEEVFGSPAISNGRVYIPSIGALYCFGAKEPAATTAAKPVAPAAVEDKTVAQILLTPVELMLEPGKTAQLQVRGYNAVGQFVKVVKDAEITVQGGGAVGKDHVYTAPSGVQVAGVLLSAKSGEMTATARIRVISRLPWKFDFADEKVPPVWIGADYRHKPAPLDGQKGLVKISTIPKGTRSQAWMGWTDMHDYTIQADFKATEKNGLLPDMGLIAQRYAIELQGSKRLQIRSWTARRELRFAETIDFEWKAGVWYRIKFQAENKDGAAVLRGKVWERDQAEPKEWQIEGTDATPNTTGSPGLFGNATDAEFYIDNVEVTANK